MPSLEEQHRALGQYFPGPFTILRLLTPRTMKYDEAVKAYEPYTKLLKPLPEMRTETLTIVRKAIQRQVNGTS